MSARMRGRRPLLLAGGFAIMATVCAGEPEKGGKTPGAPIQWEEVYALLRDFGLPDLADATPGCLRETVSFEPADAEGPSRRAHHDFLVWMEDETEDGFDIVFEGILPLRAARTLRIDLPAGRVTVRRTFHPEVLAVPGETSEAPSPTPDDAASGGDEEEGGAAPDLPPPSMENLHPDLAEMAQLHQTGKKALARYFAEQYEKELVPEQRVEFVETQYAHLVRRLQTRAALIHLAGDEPITPERHRAYRKALEALAARFPGAKEVHWPPPYEPPSNEDGAGGNATGENEEKNDAEGGKDDADRPEAETEKAVRALLDAVTDSPDPGLLETIGLFRIETLGTLAGWCDYARRPLPDPDHPAVRLWKMGLDAVPALLRIEDRETLTPFVYRPVDTLPHALPFAVGDDSNQPLRSGVLQHLRLRKGGMPLPTSRRNLARRLVGLILPAETFSGPDAEATLASWRRRIGVNVPRRDYLIELLRGGNEIQRRLAFEELKNAGAEEAAEAVETALDPPKNHPSRFTLERHPPAILFTMLAEVDRDAALALIRKRREEADGWQKQQFAHILIRLGDEEAKRETLATFRRAFGRQQEGEGSTSSPQARMQQYGDLFQTLQAMPEEELRRILEESPTLRPDGVAMLLTLGLLFNKESIEPETTALLERLLDDRRPGLLGLEMVEVRHIAALALRAFDSTVRERQTLLQDMRNPERSMWMVESALHERDGKPVPPDPEGEKADEEAVEQAVAALLEAEAPGDYWQTLTRPRQTAILARARTHPKHEAVAAALAETAMTVRSVEIIGEARAIAALAKTVRALEETVLTLSRLRDLLKEVHASDHPAALMVRKGRSGSGVDVILYALDPRDISSEASPMFGLGQSTPDFLVLMRVDRTVGFSTSLSGELPKEMEPLLQREEFTTVPELLTRLATLPPWAVFVVDTARFRSGKTD